MKNFLLFCSGVNRSVLANAPTEESKYVGLGGAVVTTSAMAALGGYFFIRMVVPAPTDTASIVAGLGWGLAIFNLDRWLISSARRQKDMAAEIRASMPRVGLALLFGSIISTPLVLQIFSPEIENQMALNRAEARQVAARKASQNPLYQEMESLQAANAELRSQIAAHKAHRDTFYKEYLEEAEGRSGTGRWGKGLVFKEKGQRLKEAEGELRAFQQEIAPQIAQNAVRLRQIAAQKDAEVHTLDTHEGASTGILARMRALHQLVLTDPWLLLAHTVLALFIMAIDCLPMIAKLTQSLNPRRPYDVLMEAEEDRAIQLARLHTEEAKASADMEIALMQEEYTALRAAEIASITDRVRQIADARRVAAQIIIDEWTAQLHQHVQQNLHQCVGTAAATSIPTATPVGATAGAATGSTTPSAQYKAVP